MKSFYQFKLTGVQSQNTFGKGTETIQTEAPLVPEIAGPCPPPPGEEYIVETLLSKGRNKKA